MKERREMEKQQLDEKEEKVATQASRKKENDATIDGGETKLHPNQVKQTSKRRLKFTMATPTRQEVKL